jgi:uncharacterized protein YfaS (alpha-2-macroglobulin family)
MAAAAGGHAVDLPLQANAMRGTWNGRRPYRSQKAGVASQAFLVEDFVPDRIEFDLTAPKRDRGGEKPASITVDGRFLYGAPAAGLALEGDVR